MIRFDELMGQRSARELLQRMLSGDRVPQGLLFQGPEGVGKGSLARAVATALLCESPQPEACGDCPSCHMTENGSHPDLLIVERLPRKGAKSGDKATLSSFIVVDQIRQLSQFAAMAPRHGPRRAFVLDPADQMNREAQNALLKTLEEPPGRSLLILVASRPQLLLPTVRSRCFAISFGPLRTDELAELLRSRGFSADEALARAALSEGRPGLALSLDLERLLAQRKELLECLESLAGDPSAIRDLPAMAARLAGKTQSDLLESLALLAGLLRDAALAAIGSSSVPLTHADLERPLAALGARLGPDRISELVSSLDRQRFGLRLNLNRTLVAESLLAAVAGGPVP